MKVTEQKSAKDKVQDQFSRNAEKYVTSETHAKGEDLPLILEWLNPQKDQIALDIATGGGHVTKQLASYVAHVFATDLTRDMLGAARRHLEKKYQNVWFIAADAEDLPFLDGYFDIVTCRIAAHHFPDPNQFIKEAARVLKPEGYFLFIDNVVPENKAVDEFVNKLEKLRDDSHVRCQSVETWTRWAQEVGFQVVNSKLRKKKFDYPTWVRRTTTSEEQIKQVDQHILNGKKEFQEYCGLVMNASGIESIHIDEWMVLFQKEIRR